MLKRLKCLVTLISLLIFGGCSLLLSDIEPTKKKIPDTPPVIKIDDLKTTVHKKKIAEIHKQTDVFVQKADTLLFEGHTQLAFRQYTHALSLDPDNIPAVMGLSKCYLKENKHNMAYSSLSRIEDRAKRTRYSPEFSFLFIQASISQAKWDNAGLKKIENAYNFALPAYRNKPEFYYYMGLACKKFFQYNRAKTFFSKVISFKSEFTENAYDQINKILELERCKTCEFREKLPLISQLSRADMAYLLHHELNIHELLTRFSSYRSRPQPQTARDIDAHPLKNEIQAILTLNLSGLSLFRSHQFQAEMPMTRGDLALIIYELSQRVVPQSVSSFDAQKQYVSIADIRPSQYFYRSIVFCTEHFLMLPLETGEFDPYGPVSGADAILSIRTLKQFIDQNNLAGQ
ncbi:MAG: tetratricopeptide repeat protein [Candidatus Magnetomorum sp.]|nr:tetratricopeptide repeat protein [Candidatus Magnetomorum sp.]